MYITFLHGGSPKFWETLVDFATIELGMKISNEGVVTFGSEKVPHSYKMDLWSEFGVKHDVVQTAWFHQYCKSKGYTIYKAERII